MSSQPLTELEKANWRIKTSLVDVMGECKLTNQPLLGKFVGELSQALDHVVTHLKSKQNSDSE